jgi:hypothetical protein
MKLAARLRGPAHQVTSCSTHRNFRTPTHGVLPANPQSLLPRQWIRLFDFVILVPPRGTRYGSGPPGPAGARQHRPARVEPAGLCVPAPEAGGEGVRQVHQPARQPPGSSVGSTASESTCRASRRQHAPSSARRPRPENPEGKQRGTPGSPSPPGATCRPILSWMPGDSLSWMPGGWRHRPEVNTVPRQGHSSAREREGGCLHLLSLGATAEPKTKRKWPAVPRATRTKRKIPAAGRSRYALPSRRI